MTTGAYAQINSKEFMMPDFETSELNQLAEKIYAILAAQYRADGISSMHDLSDLVGESAVLEDLNPNSPKIVYLMQTAGLRWVNRVKGFVCLSTPAKKELDSGNERFPLSSSVVAEPEDLLPSGPFKRIGSPDSDIRLIIPASESLMICSMHSSTLIKGAAEHMRAFVETLLGYLGLPWLSVETIVTQVELSQEKRVSSLGTVEVGEYSRTLEWNTAEHRFDYEDASCLSVYTACHLIFVRAHLENETKVCFDTIRIFTQ